jgi:hypothetical protein
MAKCCYAELAPQGGGGKREHAALSLSYKDSEMSFLAHLTLFLIIFSGREERDRKEKWKCDNRWATTDR